MFNQKKFDRDFNIMSIIFKIMFTLTFFIIICSFIVYIWVGVKTYQAIDQNGLKNVIERVWEGPNGTIR